MKLYSLTIKNFRSYREAVTVYFDNFTAFVGKNDIGKSTILEALDSCRQGSKRKCKTNY